jgi:hypothetical protein
MAAPALAQPPLSGNVEVDFTGSGVLIIPDPIGDVGLPGNATPGTVSGWDMKDLRLAYDVATDTMYIGINVGFNASTILGDADGDGNPGVTSSWLATNGGQDLANLAQSETAAVYFDLDQNGVWDVIGGISGSGTTDYSGFSVNNFTEPFFPPLSFGAALPTNTGSISPNPDALHPDLEFTVTNWTALPGNDGDFSFCVGAFLGSLQDDGIGEDFLDYCQSPDICIEKTVDCNGDGNFSREEAWYAGDNATWKVVVTNCGTCNLTNVIVTDSNGHNFGAPFDLAVAAPPVEFTYDTVVNVSTTNNATVTANDALGGTVFNSSFAINNVIGPGICIEKTVDCNGDGNFSDEETWYAGDVATWKVVVTNCGTSNLTNVTITDTNGHNFGAPFNLPVGADPVEFTYDTVVSVNTTNNATVTASDSLGGTVSDWDVATNYVISPPDICIEKTVDCNNDTIFLDEDVGYAGDTAHWKVVVWNCGGSNLTNVIVTDTNGHNFGAPFDLPAGAPPVEFNYDTVVNVDTTNNASVTATDAVGGTVSDWDIATNLVISSGICIDKTVDCNNDGVFWNEDYSSANDTAHWKVVVWNCGGSNLTNVTVTDTNGHNFGAPFDLPTGAPPVEFNYDTIVSVDTTNWARVEGYDAAGTPVWDEDWATNHITSTVGWAVLPVNRLRLLAPWVVLLGCAGVLTLLMLRKRRQA